MTPPSYVSSDMEPNMQSTFSSSRIFNDHDGWYVVMRESDGKYLTGTKYKFIGEQHLMGPFKSKDQTENWFQGYIAMHGENREIDDFLPDNVDSYH